MYKPDSFDLVTRCRHFINKEQSLLIFKNRRYAKCPVCFKSISRSQRKEMIYSRLPWTAEDLETTTCPLSYLELAILACESARFFRKISFEFVMKKLLETGFKVDQIVYKRSLLSLVKIASRNGNIEAIKQLVGVGLPMKNEFFDHSPTIYAVQSNNLSLLTFLLDHGARISEERNILVDALSSLNGDSAVFYKLIELGFDPKDKLTNVSDNLLMFAVKLGYFNAVKRLVEDFKFDVNERTLQGNTALIYAYGTDDMRIVDFLLEKGANTDFSGDDSKKLDSAFQIVCRNPQCSLPAIKFFYNVLNQPDINSYDSEGQTPLIYAARSGNMEFFDFLIEKGAKVNFPSKCGYLPINMAFWHGHFDILKKLIDLGCDLNKLPPGGKRLPIHEFALKDPHYQLDSTLKMLFDLGAFVDARDIEGRTCLHVAAHSFNRADDFIRKMVKVYGADVNAETFEGKRPIDITMVNEIEKLLLELGSKPKRKWWDKYFECFTSK